jgi:hypothetical protein
MNENKTPLPEVYHLTDDMLSSDNPGFLAAALEQGREQAARSRHKRTYVWRLVAIISVETTFNVQR